MHSLKAWFQAIIKETAPAVLLIFGIGSTGATYIPALTSLMPLRSYTVGCAMVAFAWANFRAFQKLRERLLELELSRGSVLESETGRFVERLVSDLTQDQIGFLKEVVRRGGRASGADLNQANLGLSTNLYAIAVSLEKKDIVSIEKMVGGGLIVGFENRQSYTVKREYREALARILLTEKQKPCVS